MGKRVSDEDWQRAEALYAIGKTFRQICTQLEGRVSPSALSSRARDKGWLKGVLPERLISEDTPQVFERADAGPDEVARNTDKLQEAQRRRWVDQKAILADRFGQKIEVLLDRAFSPYTVKDVKLVGQGEGRQQPTLTEIPLDMPPPADQVKLLTGLAILVDKASLLSGDATSRVETASLNKEQLADRLTHFRDEIAERRKAAEEAATAAKERGATG